MGPGVGLFVGCRRLEHQRFLSAGADDVEADGESAFGEAAGYAGRRLAAHVEEEVEGVEAPELVLDRLPIDDLWRLANCKGRGGHHGA